MSTQLGLKSAALTVSTALITALTLVMAPTATSASDHAAGPTKSTVATDRADDRADARVGRAAAAQEVARDLGAGKSSGVWYSDARDAMVVNVTTRAAAREVRRDGFAPRIVDHSTKKLRVVTRTLRDRVATPGTAWAIDPVANEVVVTLDSTVSRKADTRITRITRSFPERTSVERIKGSIVPTLSGGQAIYGGGHRCSLGFNVRSGGTYYFLTAGHCTNLSATWYADPGQTSPLGNRVGSSFPGDDYGIVQYTTTPGAGDVYLYNGSYQDITSAGNAYVGQPVTRSGSTTGLHTGTVQQLNATVNYPEGQVSGLIRTNVCAEGGDSGGALFAGSTALGLTSGGSGNCAWGGTTYFQPVTEPLNAYGVSVY